MKLSFQEGEPEEGEGLAETDELTEGLELLEVETEALTEGLIEGEDEIEELVETLELGVFT